MTSEDFFNSIQQQLDNKKPFVAYRKPKSTCINAMLQNTDAVHVIKDYTEKGFVFAPFDASNDAILIPIKDSLSIDCDLVNYNVSETRQSIFKNLEFDKPQHINLVQKGIDAIKKNQFQKVVLSRCETVEFSETNPIEIFKSLLQNYQSAFVYCWYHPKIGLWLGATPETLIEVEGSRFKTMALAGTQKYNGTLDIIWENKEKEEQQFVTDFIVNSLQNSVSNIFKSETETVRAGNIVHLKTVISGIVNFKEINLKEVLEALHPTPAVCGLPKEKAKQFILKHESYNREYYTGFLGELNLQEKTIRNSNRRNVENNAYASVKKKSNLFVNLRCMQISDNTASIYIGGGITKDSIPEAEWQETIAKSEVMKKVLQ
ncbi:isochorismate synthase [Flavobacteriaceae bacterium LYZ1037]|nr:isochorismate synthase [Flavobacteriaceae bacterium LYZ1037]